MIDTHAHIDTEAFDDDRDEVINRALESGVEKIIIPAIEEKYFEKLFETVNKNDNLFCGIGVHPHNATEVNDSTLQRIESLAGDRKVVAIGETGLDYYYDFAPKDVQQNVFREHLRIAKRCKLPAIVHNRDSDDDLLKIIEEEQDGTLKGVLHCFSSSAEVMEKALSLGFHISFTGNITFKKTTLGDVVKKVPIDRVMLETDSPYMTPRPFRGKRNEPFRVRLIAEKIAEYKSISFEEVVSMTTKTAKKLFNLLILLLIFSFTVTLLKAQSEDDNYGDDEEYFDEGPDNTLVNPYPKFIGISLYGGLNTPVETYDLKAGEDSRSSPGFAAFGGGINYSPADYVVIEASYIYSKNTKYQKEWEAKGVAWDPDIYHMYEIGAHWIPNPYSRINFFATTGLSYLHMSLNKKVTKKMCISTGIGFMGNINTSIGLIDVVAEWRLNFALGSNELIIPIGKNLDGTVATEQTTSTTFFSLPRFGIVFYPKLRE